MLELPLNHYRHLKRLADLRRCDVVSAAQFLFANVQKDGTNWLDPHWGTSDEVRRIDLAGHTLESVLDRIQGLPRNIRPVTDGPYLEKFEFVPAEAGLMAIVANGMNVADFEMSTTRDESVFALVRDLLPTMSVSQYRLYNTFNSQCLRLIRQPELFTMPSSVNPAIDAGCYVGYKALAMAHFVEGQPVLAFELASDNFDVLKRNIAANPQFSIRPFQVALSDGRRELEIHTRNERTMAHSLNPFSSLKEHNTGLLASGLEDDPTGTVTTVPLDEFTSNFDRLSAVHISVNGHEPEVIAGASRTARKADILRISCPYIRDGRPVRDLVKQVLSEARVAVHGKSGGAVIAGAKPGDYHFVLE